MRRRVLRRPEGSASFRVPLRIPSPFSLPCLPLAWRGGGGGDEGCLVCPLLGGEGVEGCLVFPWLSLPRALRGWPRGLSARQLLGPCGVTVGYYAARAAACCRTTVKGRPSTGGLWGVGRLYAARLPGHHRLQPACRAVNTGRPAPSGGRKWAVRRPVRPLPTAPVLFDRQRLRPVKHRPQRLHPPEQLSEPRTHARRRRRRRLAHLFAMWGSRLPARAAGDSRSGRWLCQRPLFARRRGG